MIALSKILKVSGVKITKITIQDKGLAGRVGVTAAIDITMVTMNYRGDDRSVASLARGSRGTSPIWMTS